MILRQLRDQKRLSQEQLATMSGLSVRTIQRIERGQRASLESLKALASALETNVSRLEQEVFVIDKTSEEWKRLPLLFRINFIGSEFGWLGLSDRQQWLKAEKFAAFMGLSILPLGFINPMSAVGGLVVISLAYLLSIITRLGDHYRIW